MPHIPFRLLDELRQDVTYAAKTFLRTREFAVAVLSLGLAAGATTAVHTTADWLLNRPPGGVVEPDAVVALVLTERGREAHLRFGFSYPQYLELRKLQDRLMTLLPTRRPWASHGPRPGPASSSIST